MKQKTKRIAILLAVLCLGLCGALALFLRAGSGRAPALPEPEFAVGDPHTDTLVFRLWFETMTSTSGPCTVSVQQAIYEEAQAETWWYAIQSDLAVLEQGLGLEADTPFTVYLVEAAPSGGQLAGHSLYCTPEDVLSGGYREGLIGAALITDACTGPLAVLESVSADAPGCADALSYSQALAFSDYLIRTCGLSAFLDYCLEPDAAFAEICGMEFEAAMTAWLEELLG